MPIREIDGRIAVVKLELAAAEIPRLLTLHAQNYPGAPLREQQAQLLRQHNFGAAESTAFLRSVYTWGRGHRNVDRAVDGNEADEIATAFREADALAATGQTAQAVQRVQQLDRLGQSFASKHVRFLAPTQAVVLDSVIRTALGYEESVEGYTEFLADCGDVLRLVRQSQDLDVTYRTALRVCDVEAAIFAKLQGY